MNEVNLMVEAGAPLRPHCPCGSHASIEEHRRELGSALREEDYAGEEQYIDRSIETAVVRTRSSTRPAPKPTWRVFQSAATKRTWRTRK